MHIVSRYLSFIAVIPCIAGLVRFRRIGKTYQPLFLMCLAGLVSDALSHYLIHYLKSSNDLKFSNSGISNTYALLEWILIFWQFRVWGFFRARTELAYGILLVPCMLWLAENLIFGNMSNFSPYFRILC